MVLGNEKAINTFIATFITLALARFGLVETGEVDVQALVDSARELIMPLIENVLLSALTTAITWLTANSSKGGL